jgi:hypothetical protein
MLLACGLVGACTATSGTSAASGAGSTATAAASPAAHVVPLLGGCSHEVPCKLQAGTYETSGRWAFLRGLRVTVPAGWFSEEQDAGEFNLHPVDQPDAVLFFSKDIVATANDLAGTPLAGVSGTADGFTSWLTSNPDLVVTRPLPAMVGHVQAIVVDVQTSPTAMNVDSGCPAKPCVSFLRDVKHWEGPLSISHAEVVRMYVGTIGPADRLHTFVAAIDFPGTQGAALETFTERVRPILDSVVIPDVIVDN